MSVESLSVKQISLRSSFTICCTSIEEAFIKDTSLTDLYALQRQIMDKFTRLDTMQEHILELLLSDELVSSEYEEDFTKAEKYRDKMNQLFSELEYATIVLKLCYNNNEMVLRCLLENGSQKSYLTQRVIDHLNLKPASKPTIVLWNVLLVYVSRRGT
ncbi:hypothetical protein NPIL_452231 [Nephila pilipes]|uniref:Uncharacterized protein n=1 Tax=Nephila pilipes TaxID=299642 RepID=A0A8X6QL45_NEPPI|nr:hypothetical protein NPIL_452231 [Nephila pilipes]